ncbi:NAD(P)/FAD-dependent oxidoreductase [Actinotalea solisilvae]|uniref:NAD(P)/FAD-dependent oxidoreductase n=1 Tax=Actinotalea solisilvae TaxID=2072922 RepID=UPI0027DCAEE1|nr:FAD-dependent oxidoreductase [Actinotalea solisilvae]
MPAVPPASVVVVGAGLAGAMAVTALRSSGFAGEVVLLGAEGLEPYDRPPLSKELLTRTEPAWLRDEVGADLTGADARLDEPGTALAVDAEGVTVTTRSGEVRADAAVLATGAEAVRPPGWDGALVLHTALDAAVLRAAVRPGAEVVVVGAGWIGAEVAGVAAAAGARVTVVEAADAPLATALGAAVGALTVPWYAAAGVRLLTGARVASVHAGAVALEDGRSLPADVVLVAVGARPRSAWLADALPLGPDGALAVDAHFRVLTDDGPLDHVVAVGDVARRRSPRHGWVPGGHWDGALRGPAIAVRTLLEGPHAQPGPGDDPAPYVFSTQLGHELALHGHPQPTDDVVVRGGTDGTDGTGGTTVLWFHPGTDELSAVLAVDRPRDVAAARRLFTGAALPRLDRSGAEDDARPLRALAR